MKPLYLASGMATVLPGIYVSMRSKGVRKWYKEFEKKTTVFIFYNSLIRYKVKLDWTLDHSYCM